MLCRRGACRPPRLGAALLQLRAHPGGVQRRREQLRQVGLARADAARPAGEGEQAERAAVGVVHAVHQELGGAEALQLARERAAAEAAWSATSTSHRLVAPLLPGLEQRRRHRGVAQEHVAEACAGSGVVMEKPSARNAGGLPRHSVQISSSWRIRLCSSPCVQLKKCARACTRSEASRLSTIDSICRKSVAAERVASPSCAAVARLRRQRLRQDGGCVGLSSVGSGHWHGVVQYSRV